MQWSVKRRLVYLALVVLILALIGGGAWWQTRPGPSCTDGRQNQNELDIDCGGPCARVCPFEVKPVKEVWSRIFKIGNDPTAGGASRYDVATLLRNPNRVHAARRLTYRLRLFDRDGILVTTRAGEAFLNPGEELFLYTPRLDVGNRVPERAVFEITAGPIWQRVATESPKLKITYKSFTNDPPLLVAELENQSNLNLKDIQVAAVLSDEEENALAVSSTFVDSLATGARQEIAFTWSASLAVTPTFFDFYPHFDLTQVK